MFQALFFPSLLTWHDLAFSRVLSWLKSRGWNDRSKKSGILSCRIKFDRYLTQCVTPLGSIHLTFKSANCYAVRYARIWYVTVPSIVWLISLHTFDIFVSYIWRPCEIANEDNAKQHKTIINIMLCNAGAENLMIYSSHRQLRSVCMLCVLYLLIEIDGSRQQQRRWEWSLHVQTLIHILFLYIILWMCVVCMKTSEEHFIWKLLYMTIMFAELTWRSYTECHHRKTKKLYFVCSLSHALNIVTIIIENWDARVL